MKFHASVALAALALGLAAPAGCSVETGNSTSSPLSVVTVEMPGSKVGTP